MLDAGDCVLTKTYPRQEGVVLAVFYCFWTIPEEWLVNKLAWLAIQQRRYTIRQLTDEEWYLVQLYDREYIWACRSMLEYVGTLDVNVLLN